MFIKLRFMSFVGKLKKKSVNKIQITFEEYIATTLQAQVKPLIIMLAWQRYMHQLIESDFDNITILNCITNLVGNTTKQIMFCFENYSFSATEI